MVIQWLEAADKLQGFYVVCAILYEMVCIFYHKHNMTIDINLLYKAEKPSVCPSVRPHFFGRLLYKAEKPSVCPSVRPSAFFWSSGSSPWMQGSMSNLLEMKRPSSGNTKFVFITS